MSFRTRLFVTLLLVVLVPLGGLAVGVRRELSTRLTAEYRQRVDALADVVREDVAREGDAVAQRLDALGADLARDNFFRLAVVQHDPAARRYLLDYAGSAMHLAGLALLQIQDSSGRILSSGHFRNAYDQLEPELPRLLGTVPVALVQTRTAEGPLLALARLDTVRVATRPLTLVGGVAVGDQWLRRLSRGSDLGVTLVYPNADTATGTPNGAAPPDSGEIVGAFALPYLNLLADGPVHLDTARFVVTQSLGTLRALRRRTDLWFLGALATTAAFAIAAAGWLAARVSRPLRELADKTEAIDLDRLDADFTTSRTDEIGALTRLLGTMVERLRRSTTRLREAERRAAVGDLARQVNHDVKNGLAPIRHVLRHLSQVARDDPAALAAVYEERKGTLDSSVTYLEDLARTYARLTPSLAARPCDINAAVRQAASSAGGRAELRLALADALPPALADDVALRRVLENLIGNAIDSLDGRTGDGAGTVTVSTERVDVAGADRPRIRVVVADTGRGMSRAELDRAFDDFYTTKTGGTGLGLSIVRRLVLDLGGALRVETEPGAGTRVAVELPT